MTALESGVFKRLMRTSVNTVVLSELIDALQDNGTVEQLGPDVRVTGLCTDSRRAAPGDLFFATAGQHEDGLRYAERAVERGAVAVLAERPRRAAAGRRAGARRRRGRRQGRARGPLLRPPQPAPRCRRHHRHQRQDDHVLHAALDAHDGRPRRRPRRHARRLDRPAPRAARQHHARRGGSAAPAGAHGRREPRRGGDGGQQPRAGAAPRGGKWPSTSACSRTSRPTTSTTTAPWTPTARQGPAVRDAARGGHGRAQRGRPAVADVPAGDPRPRAAIRAQRAGRRARRHPAPRRRRHRLRPARAGVRARPERVRRASSAATTSRTRWPPPPPRWRSACRRTPSPPDCRA